MNTSTPTANDVKGSLSDRGTDFIGETTELGIDAIIVEDSPMKIFLQDQSAI